MFALFHRFTESVLGATSVRLYVEIKLHLHSVLCIYLYKYCVTLIRTEVEWNRSSQHSRAVTKLTQNTELDAGNCGDAHCCAPGNTAGLSRTSAILQRATRLICANLLPANEMFLEII